MARKNLAAILLLLMLGVAVGDDKSDRPAYYNAVVRIGGCSGVIVHKGVTVSIGVSAQHCTGKVGSTVDFWNPDGTGGTARWVSEDGDSDLSLFRVWTKDTKGVSVKVQRDAEEMSGKYEGWGYPAGKGPMWKELRWEGAFNIEGLKGKRNQFRVTGGRFRNGDSGGGVFNKGKLIGITSHGSDGHKYLFSCTKGQLNSFLQRGADKLASKLVDWDQTKPPPLGSDKERTVALAEVIRRLALLEAENKRLLGEVGKVLNTPVRVQVLDPKTGKILAEQSYPFGTPIKLVLPETRK